jgi:hypothetical protein
VATKEKQNLRVEFVDEEPPTLPSTASVTEQLPESEIRAAIADIVLRSDREFAGEMVTSLQVRARLRDDSGERITLRDFALREGFDLADLGLE